jgi:hypothetical protein
MMTEAVTDIFGFGLFGVGPDYSGSVFRSSVYMPTPTGNTTFVPQARGGRPLPSRAFNPLAPSFSPMH